MEAKKEEECLPEQQTKRSPQKGGLKTIPFIIVNESLERLASQGLMPSMILYLTEAYSMKAADASSIIFIWSALSNGLALGGAFLSDSYLGRFNVIVLGSILSLLGMILLWMTTIIPQLQGNATKLYPNLFLLLSLFLISMGAGCIRPCSIAFGADQLDKKENPKNEKRLESFINWYYSSTAIAGLIAMTVIVYIQEHFGWKIGFGIPALLMLFATLTILIGSKFYVKTKVSESLFTGFGQVLVAAYRKRKLDHRTNDYCHLDPEIFAPSENNLRCLNKACMIQDPEKELNSDGSVSNRWILCSVEQVESTKTLLSVIPIWSSGIFVYMSITAGHFPVLQAHSMDRHIISSFEVPAGSFNLFLIVTIVIWVAIYDRVIARRKGLNSITRMGVGLVILCVAMAVSAVVENIRRNKAIEQGIQNNPKATVNMSAMWLIPQFVLYGLAEGLHAIAQIEFFYSQLPKSMSSIAIAMATFGMAVSSLMGALLVKTVDTITARGGKTSWLSSNVNKGHIDYYYWLLTVLNVVNFVYFLYCWRSYNVPRREVPAEEEARDSALPS